MGIQKRKYVLHHESSKQANRHIFITWYAEHYVKCWETLLCNNDCVSLVSTVSQYYAHATLFYAHFELRNRGGLVCLWKNRSVEGWIFLPFLDQSQNLWRAKKVTSWYFFIFLFQAKITLFLQQARHDLATK